MVSKYSLLFFIREENSHTLLLLILNLSKDLITHIFLQDSDFSTASITSLAISNSGVPSKQIIPFAWELFKINFISLFLSNTLKGKTIQPALRIPKYEKIN